MIYDTFLFFNEFDLLDIRLHELDAVVDKFVLVEATRTHSNKPKPLYYTENRERYAAFHDKIIHVVVEDTPDTTDAWAIERFQRDAILRGLALCRPDDIILMSDVDEIPRREAVRQAAASMRYKRGAWADMTHALMKQRFVTRGLRHWLKRGHPYVHVFALTPYIYFLNCVCVDRTFLATRMVFYRDMGRPRDLRRWHGEVIADGGWHFTCMGGVQTVLDKIAAFAHQEYNTPEYKDAKRLEEQVNRGEYVFSASGGPSTFRFVEIDDTQPLYVRAHREQFEKWIKMG
jgi:hypothetical protein